MEMPNLTDYLREHWPQVAAVYSTKTLNALADAYGESHRDYHGTSHIIDLLQKLDARRHLAKRPDLIAHAILWHDAVYRTNEEVDGVVKHRPDALNVEASAKWFEKTEVRLMPEERLEISAMVRTTNGHTLDSLPRGDQRYNDRALFLDLDLSVLALPADEFRANTTRIRAEYPHISAVDFCNGRAAFFDQYGQKEVLFYHPVTAKEFDGPARENMRRAAVELRQQAARLALNSNANRPA